MGTAIIGTDASSETILQTSVIDKLRSIQDRTQDPGFVNGVLGLYLEHTPPLLERLAEALTKKDQPTVSRIAHRIKGSSVSVGAARLAAICQSLEKADLTDANDEAIQTTVSNLKDVFASTESRLGAITRGAESPVSSSTMGTPSP